ncbi:50S ribosomal subunit protein L3 [Candidatus Hodgkinia cicadicola]|uniref:Large ribosomal subunit protein uL3 n=1 Tax=Candidatus Hodgkinia cicadicola TaxID=573658 RepID=A0ABX4MGH8_9HYPH|nr:50S ribosomal subunit protein L3 [Candidatus Hodgkinia cicadicola]
MELICVKSKMTSINGKAVSLLDVLACVVIEEGQNYINLGYNVKVLLRDFRYIDIKRTTFIRINMNIPNEFGSVFGIDDLESDLTLSVKGRTKGKGFTGAMKRYGFSGLSASHGVSLAHRSLGAIGSRQDPGRVWKGKKMAGRKGNIIVCLKSVRIAMINRFTKRIAVYGSIPGGINNILHIQQRK